MKLLTLTPLLLASLLMLQPALAVPQYDVGPADSALANQEPPPPPPTQGPEQNDDGPPPPGPRGAGAPRGPPPPLPQDGDDGPPPPPPQGNDGPDGPPPPPQGNDGPDGPPPPPPQGGEGPPPPPPQGNDGPDAPDGPPPPPPQGGDGPEGPPPPPQGEDPDLTGQQGCWLKMGPSSIGHPPKHCDPKQEKMGLLCYEQCPKNAPKYFALSCVNRPGHLPKITTRKTHVLKVCDVRDGKLQHKHVGLCYPVCPPGYKRIVTTCWQRECPASFPHRCGPKGSGSLCVRKPGDCSIISLKFKFQKFDYGVQTEIGVRTAFKTCDTLLNAREREEADRVNAQHEADQRKGAQELEARLKADADYFARMKEEGKRYSLPDKCAKYANQGRGGGTHKGLGCWINSRSVGKPSTMNGCPNGYYFKHGLCHGNKPSDLKCFGLICGSSGKGRLTLAVRKPPIPPTRCPEGKQKLGLLCYDMCPAGWKTSGLMCTRDNCPPSHPNKCGLMCFKEGGKCGEILGCLGLKSFDSGLQATFGRLFKFDKCLN